MWDRAREFQQSLYAELHATLRNTAIDVAFKPPEGKWWTREMFMPGYQKPAAAEEYDWRTQKQMMSQIGKRPDPAQRKANLQAQAELKDRFRIAEEARARGASNEEMRLILEA